MAAFPLDPSIYNLDEEQRVFFKEQTGIQDDNELRDHILQVQAEAYAVSHSCHPYHIYNSSSAGLSVPLHQTFGIYCVSFAVLSHYLTNCFSIFRFKVSKYPAYEAILKLGRERKGALLLDLGCCCASHGTFLVCNISLNQSRSWERCPQGHI